MRRRELLTLMIERGDIQGAGRCMTRMSPGRIYADFHPDAPQGISACTVCSRTVWRGMGRWWVS